MSFCCLCQLSKHLVLRQSRQQHVLLTVLTLSLLAITARASRARAWQDDSGSNWNSDSSWNGGQSWSGTRQPSSDAADSLPGPPTGPIFVPDNGGASVKSRHNPRVKDAGPHQGFSGGFLPRSQRCNNPNLPGCQSCLGDLCVACYAFLGDASFALSKDINQCVCPPGFGKILEGDLPDWWSGRRLLQIQLLPNSSAVNTTAQQVDALVQGLPVPPPPWANDCLPCPVDFYSPGGSVGFAECKPCPPNWTTGNASASVDCMVPYCQAGQEVNRRTGRCRQCPLGTYRPATASNSSCSTCPVGFTTAARGSTSRADCYVPICRPGQQLDLDLFICKNCTGNTISLGGVRSNGPYQPFCQECPTFTAAVNHTVCLDDACPPPDAFTIVCKRDQVPACGPGAKPLKLDDYCKAYPVGSQLQWVRATVVVDSATNVTSYGGSSNNFTTPAVAQCPAGAFGTPVWWPFITSFKGRSNCFCTSQTSCRFSTVGQVSADSSFAISNLNSSINITLHDPQLTSLRALLRPMVANHMNYTMFGARLGSYCVQDPLNGNGLQTSCLGPYIYNITYAPDPIVYWDALNGTLPNAAHLSGLSHLQSLTCAGCNLTGDLPNDWGTSGNLLALKHLDLGTNIFTGTLPATWGGLVNLVNFTLSTLSNMNAVVPSFWGNMRSLAYANFSTAYLDLTSCFPDAWLTRNALVPGVTLLSQGLDFCSF